MKEAFVSLEKTMLVKQVYPCTSIELPVKPSIVRKPRLHLLDTGLINQSQSQLAVRIWQGAYSIEKAKTIAETEFTLLTLPFYLVHRIERELDRIT